MKIIEWRDMGLLAPLFAGWQETMIWSCLDGSMGRAFTPAGKPPRAALLQVADFCFLAGEPDAELAGCQPGGGRRFAILVPRNEGWAAAIEAAWGQKARRRARYAFHKTAEGFDPAALARFAAALPPGYERRPLGEEEYRQALASEWGAGDLCSQFADFKDYRRRGLGVAVLRQGRLVAGASSYTVYRGGIEIEIDTHPDHRRKGLARACGAALMLECLKCGLYPSWDAQNAASAALAERLGYRFDREYPVYEVRR
ncbi:GNAT family N-acetyltransferase [Allofournierella sp.]|uniref:GNAT family N-acetyltransferase n=1 Tax=Allofournierella sp. TaxID=1940256 RepID=UPI003AB3F824